MSYEEALLQYETNRKIQQENQSFKDVILTAQILEVEGAKRLEKALKAPPGSSAKEDYKKFCEKLAELTGQTVENAHEQIKRVRNGINITGNCGGCKNDNTDECFRCARAYSDCYEA